MTGDNDNLRAAVSHDGRAVLVIDDLDRTQVETLLLYLFGLVNVIQTMTNHMVYALASGGDLSPAQAAILGRWKASMDQVSEASDAEVTSIAAKPTLVRRRRGRVIIERDRELMAFFAGHAGMLASNEMLDLCISKFGKDRTPSKAAVARFLLRVSNRNKGPLN